MAIKALKERGTSASSIARTLGVTEGAVRYHVRRQAARAVDGRAGKPHKAAGLHEAIATWLASRAEDPVNLAALHAWLVEEHRYLGSRRSVQRYVGAAFPRPAKRARRRVETPPGAQAQVDWAEFRAVPFVDGLRDLYALHMQLSHLRELDGIWTELFPAERARVLALLIEQITFTANTGDVQIQFREGAPNAITKP